MYNLHGERYSDMVVNILGSQLRDPGVIGWVTINISL